LGLFHAFIAPARHRSKQQPNNQRDEKITRAPSAPHVQALYTSMAVGVDAAITHMVVAPKSSIGPRIILRNGKIEVTFEFPASIANKQDERWIHTSEALKNRVGENWDLV
jgi:hypothetical protein